MVIVPYVFYPTRYDSNGGCIPGSSGVFSVESENSRIVNSFLDKNPVGRVDFYPGYGEALVYGTYGFRILCQVVKKYVVADGPEYTEDILFYRCEKEYSLSNFHFEGWRPVFWKWKVVGFVPVETMAELTGVDFRGNLERRKAERDERGDGVGGFDL